MFLTRRNERTELPRGFALSTATMVLEGLKKLTSSYNETVKLAPQLVTSHNETFVKRDAVKCTGTPMNVS